MKNTIVLRFGSFDQLEIELEIECDWCPAGDYDFIGYFDLQDYTIQSVNWYSPQETDYLSCFVPQKGSWMEIWLRNMIDKNIDMQKEANNSSLVWD